MLLRSVHRLSLVLAAFALLAEPRYPASHYQVHTEINVRVPMRDGVKLATDLYIPEGAGSKLPSIMIRTPYNRKVRTEVPRMFAGQGYVVAVQDVRGKFDSEGRFTVSANDTNDGSDMLDWMAAQTWSTGKIGTYGCSYLGEDQIELSKLRNPHHTTMIPQAAGGAYRFADLLEGGAVGLSESAPWFLKNGSKIEPAPEAPKVDLEQMYLTLPVIQMLKKAGAPPTDFEDFVSHEPADPWFDRYGYVDRRHHFNTPALQVCSWYDTVVNEAFLLARLMRENGETALSRDNQFVVIAPTTHCAFDSATEHTIVGKRDLADARFDYYNLYVRWYDHWLKGVDNGLASVPKLQIYVMGANKWRSENEWPLARTKFTAYYLHSRGHANGRDGDGSLSTSTPGEEPLDRYKYDPKDPVHTTGDGAQDQSDLEKRADVLVYTTPPLKTGVELTGPLEATLFVGSSARDTDFTAKLVDVYPDGTAYNLQDGILRSRYREGFNKKVWMKSGEVYRLKIDLHATSNYFPAGHRIRLEISSSNFPRFDRNLNTGGNNYDETQTVVAENALYHASRHASYVTLPVIP
jgi:putative CocE/NonD family hydrolase